MKAKWNAGEVGDSCSVTITDSVFGAKEFGVQEACDVLTAEIANLESENARLRDETWDSTFNRHLAAARVAAVRAFAEWCDAVSIEEPDALAHQGCGGGCYTDCVDGLDRYLEHLEKEPAK